MLKLMIIIFVFCSVLIFIYNLFPGMQKEAIRKRLDEDDFVVGEGARFVNIFRPFFKIFLPLISKLPSHEYKIKVERYAVTAGIEKEIAGDDFIAFQMTTCLIFALLGLVLFKSAAITLIAGILGLGYPYLWLYEKKNSRQSDIQFTMPDVIDMLSLSVEAGLDFNAAINKVCDTFRGEKNTFIEELYLMNQNMKLGKTREEALKTMADRVDMQAIYSFTSILIQSQKIGASISETLKSQAVRMRQERFMNAERAGAVASQKLLVPMVLLIFPLIFIVIFGPFILKFIYGN